MRDLPRRVLSRRWGQAQLRTRILAGVLLVTLGVLAAFDVAAVTALRGYLIGQADSQLRNVLNHRQLLNQALLPVGTKRRSQPRGPLSATSSHCSAWAGS